MVVLLPCNSTLMTQRWIFDKGSTTVTSITNVAIGKALAVSNSTLFASMHGKDQYSVSDVSYGSNGLVLMTPYDQKDCTSRNCQNYDPSQMWYFSPTEGLLRHSTYWASMNHKNDGEGYTLTPKVPTWRHSCLAHVLSTRNAGTIAGTVEVWGGLLSNSALVAALVNRGGTTANIEVRWTMFEMEGITSNTTFEVRDLWKHNSLGKKKGGFNVQVDTHDIAIFKL